MSPNPLVWSQNILFIEIQPEKLETRQESRPIGFRKSRNQNSSSGPGYLPLADTSQQEQDQNESGEYDESGELSTSIHLQSPQPIQRVVANVDDEDGLGMDDDEPAYYDSDE